MTTVQPGLPAAPLAAPFPVLTEPAVAEALPLPLRRRRRPPRQRPAHSPPESRPPIAAIAPEDRPRERLLRGGPGGLSDSELLAVLLRSGRPGRSVLAIADDFLAACGGLAGLAGCDLDVIRRQSLGEVQAASLMAAVELGRRLARGALPPEPLEDPARVARHLYLRYHRLDQEVMGALYLDSRHRRVGESELFRGTWARMLVEPRPILREAIRRNAQGILLFHLHPSGDPTPSQEDKVFTERMRRCCEHMGFDLLDHLILGGERWLSLRRLVPW